MSHSSLDLIMDHHLKRTRELQEFEKLINPLGNVTKKQKSGGKTRMSSNDDDKEESDRQHWLAVDAVLNHVCVKTLTKEKRGTSTEARLKNNRLRAREVRKRNKTMIEDMRKQSIFLTIENDNLHRENQMQKQEITLLRENSQLLLSNHRVSYVFYLLQLTSSFL